MPTRARWLLELLQTTFDTFDTLAETFSVQRVRKTVNESYMVAAGLPDPTLLRSPVDRALATAGFGLALCGVMDVLNAQMAQRMGGGGKGTADGRRRGSGGAPPTLDVQVGSACNPMRQGCNPYVPQVGVNSGSACNPMCQGCNPHVP